MKQISREQAEKLFEALEVVNTRIKQDGNELRVILSLSNHQDCHVTYNYTSHQKSYHLDNDSNTAGNQPLPPAMKPNF